MNKSNTRVIISAIFASAGLVVVAPTALYAQANMSGSSCTEYQRLSSEFLVMSTAAELKHKTQRTTPPAWINIQSHIAQVKKMEAVMASGLHYNNRDCEVLRMVMDKTNKEAAIYLKTGKTTLTHAARNAKGTMTK